ncbi:MAG: phosphatidate cytidylyltransferase [Desulfobacterales bacterium]|jgi:phosphatidate cytidylyltransferase
MHLKRWLTSIVLLPLLLLLIFRGGEALFFLLIAAVDIVILAEYCRIVFHPRPDSVYRTLSYLMGTLLLWYAFQDDTTGLAAVLGFDLMIAGFICQLRFADDPAALERMFRQVAGMIYGPLLLACLIWLRRGADGPAWILVVLCLSFAGDTVAYYAGTYLGRHRLAPKVSPKKTVEGAVGGLVGAVGVAAVAKAYLLPGLPWAHSMAFFVVAAAAGQVGDLFESTLKRAAGIKDSGELLPGHGGLLDRIDALLFVVPVALAAKWVLG